MVIGIYSEVVFNNSFMNSLDTVDNTLNYVNFFPVREKIQYN